MVFSLSEYFLNYLIRTRHAFLALSKIFLSFSDSCVLGTVSTRPRVSFVGEFFSSEFFCLVLFYSFYLEAEANRLFFDFFTTEIFEHSLFLFSFL